MPNINHISLSCISIFHFFYTRRRSHPPGAANPSLILPRPSVSAVLGNLLSLPSPLSQQGEWELIAHLSYRSPTPPSRAGPVPLSFPSRRCSLFRCRVLSECVLGLWVRCGLSELNPWSPSTCNRGKERKRERKKAPSPSLKFPPRLRDRNGEEKEDWRERELG